MTTHVLFQSSKIKIQYENDIYSIVATDDLKVGERVLLELVVWSPKIEYIIAAIIQDETLTKELYPRNTNDPGKKASMNVFKFDENFVLGKVFSKFNHSCTPNCHMDAADFVNDSKIYGMWVHRNIKAGEELTIDYIQLNDVDYHDNMKKQHGFECSCSHEYITMNDKRVEIHRNLGNVFRTRDRELTESLVDNFMKSRNGKIHLQQKNKIKQIEKKVLVC